MITQPEQILENNLVMQFMFLMGFDAPSLNTLFVDKNLRYHGLMQAFSCTNRIYNATKNFGNIVTFRDLEQSTIDAITLFDNKNTKTVVLEKSFKEYLEGFTDVINGKARRGYIEIVSELNEKVPGPDEIVTEKDKKAFAKLFGEYLRVENILQNFDEFTHLKALKTIDVEDAEAVEAFKDTYFVTDEDVDILKDIDVPVERVVQDYCSTYNDIRDWLRNESLVVDFIHHTDLDVIPDTASIIDAFFAYAQTKQKNEASEIITDENLNEEAAKRYITTSLKKEYATENGTELNALLPKMSPLNPQCLTKKHNVFQKISAFVEKFKGVGGEL